jgi:hypothetical protein
MKSFAAALVVTMLLAGAARAECPAGWGGNETLTSATASAEFGAARLNLSQAASVTLHPVSEVRFAAPPAKRGDASSYGGMLELDAREAGTYQVSLSAGAWIDMLKDGMEISSTAHAHDAGCSDLRKIVSFPLTPGRYVIQLSGNKDATIRVLVSPKVGK